MNLHASDQVDWADVPAARRQATPEPQPMREAAGAFDEEDEGYRSLTGVARRDLSSLSQAQMQKLAAFLWESNLLANRLIELPVAYLVAEGVRLTCQDEDHQRCLDAFWDDPINKMDLRLPTFVRELSLFGEQCWPTYVNDVNGHVRLGYLDPSLIDTVVMDPGNAAQEIGVRTVKDQAGNFRQFRVIVRGEDDELFAAQARAARAGFDSGDAFYFAVNKYAAGRRGRSDLIAQMDWLDAYDEFMFDQVERAGELDAYVWDVTMKGATEEDIKEKAKTIKRPGRGSVRVHNDQEEWKAEAPSLNSVDRAESARMFRNHALGGATVPEHWYGGGGDVNRASAAEMGDPFFKVATMRQTTWKHILVELGRYVLYMRAKARGETPDWGDRKRWGVAVAFPEMVSKDVTKIAAALQACVVAVAAALNARLISRKTALTIIATAAARLEVEIDPAEELKKVDEETPPPDPGAGPGASQLGVPADLTDDDDGNPQAQ